MKVLLCDDHPVFLDGMRLLLTELGHQVVAEATTGEEAVAAVAVQTPDVIVMDLHLPGISGVEATRSITTAHPEIGILVLTMAEDDATLLAALRAGARGYLLKGAGHHEVERALTGVLNGDLIVSGRVAGSLRGGLRTGPSPFPDLTRREHEILELVARGRTNEQIAAGLFLSIKTVRNNVSTLFTKLGVANRAQAVALARDRGVGQNPDTA